MKVIICPVGTSSLTNTNDLTCRALVNTHANARKPGDIPGNDLTALDKYISQRMELFESMDIAQAKEASAELHSLLILIETEPPNPDDVIYLIPSDTYIGKHTASMVETYLSRINIQVRGIGISGMQTKCSADFHAAMVLLVREIDAIVAQYKPQGAKFIFNLTGGFKAVQGFLQTLGSVYADETIYIFERESELMRIPRLPLRFHTEDYITHNLNLWRRMSLYLRTSIDQAAVIPDSLYFNCDGECALSEYGELVWTQLKQDIYSLEVFPPPTPKAILGDRFLRSVVNLNGMDKIQVNVQIDKLAQYLESEQQDALNSLRFHDIGGNAKPGSTHEFYAASNNGAPRVYCHFNSNGLLVLDEYGHHLR